jgi:hypothetical protein
LWSHANDARTLAQYKSVENKRGEAIGHLGRITSISDLPKAKMLLALIKEAAKLNDAGIESPGKRKPAEKKVLAIPTTSPQH